MDTPRVSDFDILHVVVISYIKNANLSFGKYCSRKTWGLALCSLVKIR
jgi:hypothetical protein